MKYDRDFLIDVHNDIKNDLDAVELVPHRSKQHLISRFTYGCDFYTLRYWRSCDTAWMTEQWYNQSNIEIVGINDKLYIGIWFGKNNKDYLQLLKHKEKIIEKADDFPDYHWTDENGNPADSDLIKWLYENDHETEFRKELASYDRTNVVEEILHLKEYLDILLMK